MSQKYSLRHYERGDEGQIVSLLQRAFNGWPRIDLNCTPLDHWKWKFLDNPINKIYVTVAHDKGRIVGSQHGTLVKIKMGDDIHLCSVISDLAVDPDYRRMGIWSSMNELRGEKGEELGVEISYWMSSNPIVIRKYLDLRPSFPHPISNLVRIKDIDLHLEKMPMERDWLTKIGFSTVKRLNELGNLFRESFSSELGDVETVTFFGEEFDEFWDKISDDYGMIVMRNREYVNWRYCDPRAGNFKIKKVEEDGAILGYSVLKINKGQSDYPMGFIIDFLALPSRHDAANALIADAVSNFDRNDVNIINVLMVKGHPYKELLNRHGFIDSRIKVHVIFNPRQLEKKQTRGYRDRAW